MTNSEWNLLPIMVMFSLQSRMQLFSIFGFLLKVRKSKVGCVFPMASWLEFYMSIDTATIGK